MAENLAAQSGSHDDHRPRRWSRRKSDRHAESAGNGDGDGATAVLAPPSSGGRAAQTSAPIKRLAADSIQTSVVLVGFVDLPAFVMEHGAESATNALLSAARVIGTTIRTTDYSFLADDHTFEIVLVDCGPEDAAIVAMRIRLAIETMPLEPGCHLSVTTRVVTTTADR